MPNNIGTIYHLLPQGDFIRPFNFHVPLELTSYAKDRLGPHYDVILQNIFRQIQVTYGEKANYIQSFVYRQYELTILSDKTNEVMVSTENLRRNLQ